MGWFVGIVVAAAIGAWFAVWLQANYAADLEYVIEPDKGPDMRKADQPEVRGKYRTQLLEARFKVRNKGIRAGALDRCEVAPLGVHVLPKVELTYVDRRPLSWRETDVRMIQFRYEEPAVYEIAQDMLTWQIGCYDTAGTYVGTIKAAAVLRKGDKPEPIPYDVLRSPMVDD